MGKMILRSRAVFDGISDTCRPMAICMEDDRITDIFPWDLDGIAGLEDIPVTDVGDQMVMPSFIDAHTHVFSGAITASNYVCSDLAACCSEEECAEKIADFAKAHPDYRRIRGTGWFLGAWTQDSLPNKRSLDRLIPDVPVYLQCADGHSMWLNSAALRECGIRPDPDFPNGIIETFPDGELTGMLIEPAAFAPAMEKYMEFSDEEMYGIHRNFRKVLAQQGVAGLSEMFAEDYIPETYHSYDILKKLDEEEGLYANIYIYTKLFGYTSFEKYWEMKAHYNSPHVKINGVKGFIDGVTETYTGLLLEPYTDRPDSCGEGLPLWPRERMEREIEAANREGIQVRLHCIADGSVRMALDMYERSAQINGEKGLRNTVEHIENIHPDDIERFHKLHVVASMQPYHLILANNDKIYRLGSERCRYEWPMKSICDTGADFAVGTDYPVVALDPMRNIYAAVTRKDDNGNPSGHNPREVLDMATVLRAYTYGAAFVYHAEDETGSIERGKKANLIVLDRNLFAVDPEEIPDTEVVLNIFEGNEIYRK